MDAIYVIPPISTSVFFIFVYSMYSTVEYYYQKTGKIAIATTISASLNLVLNYFGIRLYGYHAAGYTTLICYICLSICHYLFYKTIIKKELPQVSEIYNLKLIIAIGLFMITFMCVMAVTYEIILIRYLIITVLIAVLIIFRKRFIDAIGLLKK